MNLQQIFDKVSDHLLTQNAHSLESKHIAFSATFNTCVYRNEQGLSCAVGCLISNSAYRANMEEADLADNSLVQYALKDILGSGDEYDTKFNLLCDLQNVHDKYRVDNWPIALQECATKHNLKFIFQFKLKGSEGLFFVCGCFTYA